MSQEDADVKLGMQSLARRQTVYTTGMLLVGGLEAAIAFGVVGLPGVEGVVCSVLLCLVPGWLTIYVSSLIQGSEIAPYAVLLGTGFRMCFVLVGLLAIRSVRPDLGFREFAVWLVVNYLVALALETWIVLVSSESSLSG